MIFSESNSDTNLTIIGSTFQDMQFDKALIFPQANSSGIISLQSSRFSNLNYGGVVLYLDKVSTDDVYSGTGIVLLLNEF